MPSHAGVCCQQLSNYVLVRWLKTPDTNTLVMINEIFPIVCLPRSESGGIPDVIYSAHSEAANGAFSPTAAQVIR